jgi:hypothetical protein
VAGLSFLLTFGMIQRQPRVGVIWEYFRPIGIPMPLVAAMRRLFVSWSWASLLIAVGPYFPELREKLHLKS